MELRTSACLLLASLILPVYRTLFCLGKCKRWRGTPTKHDVRRPAPQQKMRREQNLSIERNLFFSPGSRYVLRAELSITPAMPVGILERVTCSSSALM